MRKLLPSLCIIALVILSSCGGPKTVGSLRMQLHPTFGGLPMRTDSTYASPDGRYYIFDVFNMYFSHIKLIRTDGSAVEVSPLAFVSVNDSTARNPYINLSNVNGSFSAVEFSIGLDSIQNNTPESNDQNSPYFSDNSMYWGPGLLYVFVELSGYADTNQRPVQGIGYHLGTNAFYRTVRLNKSFTLSGSTATTLGLNVDLRSLFYGGSTPINVMAGASEDILSTSPNPALAQQFSTNFNAAFSLQ